MEPVTLLLGCAVVAHHEARTDEQDVPDAECGALRLGACKEVRKRDWVGCNGIVWQAALSLGVELD